MLNALFELERKILQTLIHNFGRWKFWIECSNDLPFSVGFTVGSCGVIEQPVDGISGCEWPQWSLSVRMMSDEVLWLTKLNNKWQFENGKFCYFCESCSYQSLCSDLLLSYSERLFSSDSEIYNALHLLCL